MNLFIRVFVALIFIFFSYLQHNDSEGMLIWTLTYALTAVFILSKKSILQFLGYLLLSICSILFIHNIDLLITLFLNPDKGIKDELFYELGGIMLILSICYIKFAEE